MEIDAKNIGNVVAVGAWGSRGERLNEERTIPPVAKAQGGSTKKLGTEDQKSQHKFFGTNASKSGSNPEEVESMVQDIEEYLGMLKIDLNFKVDEKTGDVVVQVIDSKTGEMIRQLPPDDVLKFREKLKELRGVLFEETV